MDNKKVVFWGLIIIILILGIFLFKINSLSYNLSIDCRNFYDVNGTCPCMSTKSIPIKMGLNFSNLNLTS